MTKELTELRERLATSEKYSHLPELQSNRDFYQSIIDEVGYVDYEPIYHAATRGVTLRNTEIDRLQRIIYNLLSHDEAVEKINAAPLELARNVIRETKMNLLKQKLEAARKVRDELVAQKQDEYTIDWAHRITSAQAAVDQAKKALYIQMRENYADPFSFGVEVNHKDL